MTKDNKINKKEKNVVGSKRYECNYEYVPFELPRHNSSQTEEYRRNYHGSKSGNKTHKNDAVVKLSTKKPPSSR